MDNSSLVDLAANVKTPLALAGLVAAGMFGVLKSIAPKLVSTNRANQGVLKFLLAGLFGLAALGMVLGFAGYVFTKANGAAGGGGDSLILYGHVVAGGDVTQGVANATVFLMTDTTTTTTTSELGDFSFPLSSNIDQAARIWAKAEHFETSTAATIQLQKPLKNVFINLNRTGAKTPAQPAPAMFEVPLGLKITETAFSGNYDEIFPKIRTNELTLSQWGEAAFNAGNYDWCIRFLTQAKSVSSSGVWASSYPYFAGAYLLKGDTIQAKTTLDDMLSEVTNDTGKNGGYLGYKSNVGFLLQNLGNVRAKVSDADKSIIDQVIDKVQTLRGQAR
jgi:hypothetical protein